MPILLTILTMYLGMGIVITSMVLASPSLRMHYLEVCQLNSMGTRLAFAIYLILTSPTILLLRILIGDE